MITNLLARLGFMLKYRTFKKVIPSPKDDSQILICHAGQVIQMERQCPHQGAPLETGYFEGAHLICPWHGCRFKISNKP